jgi:hypothetical protein
MATLGLGEAAVALAAFKGLLGWAKKALDGRRAKKLISEGYRQLLLGDRCDFGKVESITAELEKLKDTSPDGIRLAASYSRARKPVATKKGKRKAAKRPARRRSAAKAPARKKAAKRSAKKAAKKRA